MKRFFGKKSVVIGTVTGLILGGTIAAFAYFTTNGTGGGSASTGSASALTIVQTNTVTGLLPGGPAQTIDYSVTNTTAGVQFVGPVTVTVTSVTSGTLTGPDGNGGSYETCATSMYSTTLGTAPGSLAPGAVGTGTATIQLKDDGNNQDNCEASNSGGALTLHFSAGQ